MVKEGQACQKHSIFVFKHEVLVGENKNKE